MAKKSIFTKAKIREICTRIGMGMTEKAACDLSEVNAESFHVTISRNPRWRKILDLEQARAQEKALKGIWDQVKGWQALAWLLERRFGEAFRRLPPVVVSQNVSQTLATGFGLTEEQLNELQEIAQKEFNQKPHDEQQAKDKSKGKAH